MNHRDSHNGSIFIVLILMMVPMIVLGYLASSNIISYLINRPAFEVLAENRELKKAIGNLSAETQIGYAKVISQDLRDGRIFSRIRFVETDRQDNSKQLLRKEYDIEGDVIHFDALIIKFGNQMVMDGKEKALYLWRRVYGEKMNPEDGFPIETEGKESARYEDICSKLSLEGKNRFWSEIWQLADDPDALKKIGIEAIFGNVVYKKVRPNLIYIFKIDSKGGLYPEVIPDI